MKKLAIALLFCAALQAENNPLIRVTTSNQNTAFYNKLRDMGVPVFNGSPRFLWLMINDDGSNAQEYRVVITVDSKIIVDTLVPRTDAHTVASWYIDVEKATIKVEPHAKSAESTEVKTNELRDDFVTFH